MYKAAYSFKHENVKIVPFKAGNLFVVLKENDNGWWLCLAQNGRIGLVPSNYIEPYEPERSEALDFIEQSSSLAPKQKPYFSVDYLPLAISVLEQLKQQVHRPSQRFNNTTQQSSSSSTQYPASSSSSSSSSTSSSLPPTPQLLPLSPSSPSAPTQQQQQHPILEQQQQTSQNNNTIELSPTSLPPPLTTKEPKLPNNLFWSLVTKIRESGDINFERSRGVLKMLLTELSLVQPSWENVISSLLDQENIDIAKAVNINNNINNYHDNDDAIHDNDSVLNIQLSLQNILLTSRDSNDLTQILEQIGQVIEDGQQSSWCLFEDLEANTQLLKQLLAVLTNANESLCSAILSREQYLSCHHLVQYYQMETRLPLRRLLIQVFSRICRLGDNFISELLSLVLPLELARQLMGAANHVTVEDDVINLLCTLFSTAEALPHQHYSCFNVDFLSHVLDLIESELPDNEGSSSPSGEGAFSKREKLIEMFIYFNQHFERIDENTCMEALRKRSSHKHLTEYLLLLFNRGGSSNSTHSSMKFLIDIFSSPSTAHIFYTNDANVLVDIIYRQINDLSPGDEERTHYLHLLHLFLLNSNYWQHPHRQTDIHASIQQVLQEDPPCERDRHFVEGILAMFVK